MERIFALAPEDAPAGGGGGADTLDHELDHDALDAATWGHELRTKSSL